MGLHVALNYLAFMTQSWHVLRRERRGEREREREADILHLVNYLKIVQLTGHQLLLHVWVEEQLLSQHELD